MPGVSFAAPGRLPRGKGLKNHRARKVLARRLAAEAAARNRESEMRAAVRRHVNRSVER